MFYCLAIQGYNDWQLHFLLNKTITKNLHNAAKTVIPVWFSIVSPNLNTYGNKWYCKDYSIQQDSSGGVGRQEKRLGCRANRGCNVIFYLFIFIFFAQSLL